VLRARLALANPKRVSTETLKAMARDPREDCPWKCKADDKHCLCNPTGLPPYTAGAPDPARLSGEAMP
jgi:hypothetical protein